MFDPEIQKYKTITMQRIQQAASRGYIHYVSGIVHHSKAQNMASKFAINYEINANENRRSYKKSKGEANSFLFIYPRKSEETFLWWLLATDGTGNIHSFENLGSVYDKHSRLNWDGDYELVLMPKADKKHSMTWRMTRHTYQSWNDRIRKSIRLKYTDDKARQAMWSLTRSPGFSGVREQVKKLLKVYDGEWKRTRRNMDAKPPTPPIGFVRGLKSDSVPLSFVIKRIKNNKRPFPRKDAMDTPNENV